MLLTLVLLAAVLAISYLLFVSYYPSFGGDVPEALQTKYASSENYKNGAFINQKDVPEDLGFWETLKIARKFFFTKVPNGVPAENIAVQHLDSIQIADYEGESRLVWFGHSAFLLQTKGKNILIDPMFGEVPAPHPMLGGKRFSKELPIEVEKLPKIDAVIISHDHYDHLDYESILKLKDKVGHFYMPLAVGVHLKAWGVEEGRITELDWWQQATLGDLEFICTPAQHFSGRKLNNRQSTLWSSWVIRSASESIFFSGDSGYGPHFKEIGEKYGPFEFAMMECGQYNESWPDIHMFPEETVQAGVDVRAKAVMPIHWGAFKLALHSWTDPIERAKKKAEALNIPLVAPKIGQAIEINSLLKPNSLWWENL
ncbi:MBL fold metallo-hydrolase [Fulvivirgaceae bacterium BMA12]|uniref:MBL fold metallo-hydrolase n=1 Tax=Agaribacillus aureus TaxID=3051825 RepID=A0ABT8LBE7_9BACT|nr:MBL fold metallo-hydrolase [Fulvivirgaceae bacterium BMA12]